MLGIRIIQEGGIPIYQPVFHGMIVGLWTLLMWFYVLMLFQLNHKTTMGLSTDLVTSYKFSSSNMTSLEIPHKLRDIGKSSVCHVSLPEGCQLAISIGKMARNQWNFRATKVSDKPMCIIAYHDRRWRENLLSTTSAALVWEGFSSASANLLFHNP